MTEEILPFLVIVEGDLDDWGLIPGFLNTSDPRSAREQLNANYVMGWHPFPGFTFNPETLELTYPGDPPLLPISNLLFRNEILLLYPGEWVNVVQEDNSWEVARMD